ncbi:MAG: leucyl aminopeptidase [Alphaproteobacteria bacterium]
MTVSFAKFAVPKSGALVFPVAEGADLPAPATALDRDLGGVFKKAMAAARFKGKKGQIVEVLAPPAPAPDRVILLGLGKAEALDTLAAEQVGGKLMAHLLDGKAAAAAILAALPKGAVLDEEAFAVHLAMGLSLRDYRFEKYRTRNDKDAQSDPVKITVMGEQAAKARTRFKGFAAAADGTKLARDLVSEPPNILNPKGFAARCKALSKLGVSVDVLGEKEMARLGMHTLLGVGQGSTAESQLVIMRWDGTGAASKPAGKAGAKKGRAKGGAAPVALVGKGVCFDSGGLSLKPAGGMEEMKGDMGGAAAVVGAMHAIAARKAKADVVGVVGLVENMPDGNAIRPSDILTTLSGQTVEVINTDAEGRLVLADALWYTQDRFKPAVMIDLATLTGGIIAALGHEYAGLFTEHDMLAEQLLAAGAESGEPLWRLPMGDAYDRMIDSTFADMKNSSGRPGQSITAAQFLKRHTNGTPWAHLDIASTAWIPKPKDTSPAWATGYGARLLDTFVARHYG